MGNKLDKLKELLKDFKPVDVNKEQIKKSELQREMVDIDYKKNPLNPNLLAFCFKNVLGFEVRYIIFEKINYIINFCYKDTYGCASHKKISYNVSVSRDYEKEILEIFFEAKKLLSEYFFECGKEALQKNEFAMENECLNFTKKLVFYNKRIDMLEQSIPILKYECRKQIKEAIDNKAEWTSINNKFSDLMSEKRLEQLCLIESYIDVFFSYIEHISILLYPFLPLFKLSESYGDKIHNTCWNWKRKLVDVCCNDKEMEDIIDELKKIKEIYRNRNAHGMFSRELKVYAQINGFGKYPMYIGKNYLQGLVEDEDIELNYKKFIEIKKIFDKTIDRLCSMYEIPMAFITSGLPIPVDVSVLTNGVKTLKEAEMIIDKCWFNIDNQSNMDW